MLSVNIMPYKLVIFDVDGTLYKFEDRITSFLDTPMYKKIKKNAASFLSSKKKIDLEEAKKIIEDIYLRYKTDISIGLEKEFGIPKKEYFNNVWNIDASKYIKYNPKLRETINSLDCKKAVLSNAPPVWINSILSQLKIQDLFDKKWTGDGKIRKPSREAYLTVCEYFESEPSECIMIDDDQGYLEAAKKLGMTTVFISPNSDTIIGKADYSIKEISEIKEINGIFITYD